MSDMQLTRLDIDNIIRALNRRADEIYALIPPDPNIEMDRKNVGLVMYLDTLANRFRTLEKNLPPGNGVKLEILK